MSEDDLILSTNCSFCPECERLLPSSRPLSDMIENEVSHDLKRRLSPQKGPSTKLSYVVQNVKSSGPGAKSIVFSYWRSTLDNLSELFEQANIPHCRIDGRVRGPERSICLKAFREDPQVLVLLMSIQTGAVGLKLSVANRVHIVEPQWNPAEEEQAIARAARIGQTREVTTVRYMMEKTIEQNIVNLQERKRRFAKFTFDSGAADDPHDKLEDMKSVLDINLK